MTMIKYTANFENATAERIYAKPLAFAWRVEYRAKSDPDSAPAVKTGFSASREAAERSVKLPKRCEVIKAEIVPAKNCGAVEARPKAPKAEKPFAKGERVTVVLGGAAIAATVVSMRGKFARIKAAGALSDIKVAMDDLRKITPAPVSPADTRELIAA